MRACSLPLRIEPCIDLDLNRPPSVPLLSSVLLLSSLPCSVRLWILDVRYWHIADCFSRAAERLLSVKRTHVLQPISPLMTPSGPSAQRPSVSGRAPLVTRSTPPQF